ncbi:MAG: membrane protein insertion efficiency factor YidD [Betaproteobacteria bacterium]|nr:membrane protein insertion efficiency factor YidD [Betaproteobacteria bacterium]
MSRLIVALIQAYRYALSPLFGPSCRFHPSCSEYALEAVSRHGSLRGVWLALKRVLRCNPWHCGGHDPVP